MSASGASFEQMLLDALPRHQQYLVASYAHELAEKIRAAEWAENCAQGCCPGDTPEDVANFIDPEVSSDG